MSKSSVTLSVILNCKSYPPAIFRSDFFTFTIITLPSTRTSAVLPVSAYRQPELLCSILKMCDFVPSIFRLTAYSNPFQPPPVPKSTFTILAAISRVLKLSVKNMVIRTKTAMSI